jgi:hypothetical protein
MKKSYMYKPRQPAIHFDKRLLYAIRHAKSEIDVFRLYWEPAKGTQKKRKRSVFVLDSRISFWGLEEEKKRIMDYLSEAVE